MKEYDNLFEQYYPVFVIVWVLIAFIGISGYLLYRNHELAADRTFWKSRYEAIVQANTSSLERIQSIPGSLKIYYDWMLISQAKEIAELKKRMRVIEKRGHNQ